MFISETGKDRLSKQFTIKMCFTRLQCATTKLAG